MDTETRPMEDRLEAARRSVAEFRKAGADLERRERELASALASAREDALAAAAALVELEPKLAPVAVLEADIAALAQTMAESARRHADLERGQYANLADQDRTRRELSKIWEEMGSVTRRRRDGEEHLAADAAEARRLVTAMADLRDRRHVLAKRRKSLDRALRDATTRGDADARRLMNLETRRQRTRENLDRRLAELGVPDDPEASQIRLREERTRLIVLERLSALSRSMARLGIGDDPETRLAGLEAEERRTALILADARSLVAELEAGRNAAPDSAGLAATVASQVRRVGELEELRERAARYMDTTRRHVAEMARLTDQWREAAASVPVIVSPGDVAAVETLISGMRKAISEEERRLTEIRALERDLAAMDREDAESQRKIARSQMDALREDAKTLDRESRSLEEEETRFRERQDALSSRHGLGRVRTGRESRFLAELERRRDKAATREEALARLRERHDRLSEKRTSLQTGLRDLQRELEALAARLEELHERRSDLEARYIREWPEGDAGDRLAEARRLRDSTRNRETRLEAEAAQLAAERLVFEARFEDARNLLKRLDEAAVSPRCSSEATLNERGEDEAKSGRVPG